MSKSMLEQLISDMRMLQEGIIPESMCPVSATDSFFGDQQGWEQLSLKERMNSVQLDWSFDKWFFYSHGYKEAADRLVSGLEKNPSAGSVLIYPIMFLYRQYMELTIKHCIRLTFRLERKYGEKDDFEVTHDIERLWKKYLERWCFSFPDDPIIGAEDVTRLIEEFCKVDSGSFAFRYPEERNKSPTLSNIYYVNLFKIKDVVRKISDVFESTQNQLLEHIQFNLGNF